MMEKFNDFLVATTFFNALIFGVVFLCNQKKNDPLRTLGVFLIVFVSIYLQWIFDDVRFLPLSFSYLIVPLFYVYIKKVLGIFHKRDYLNFIPGILEFFITSIILICNDGSEEVFFRKENATLKMIFIFIVPPILNICYALLSLAFIYRHKKLIANFFTDAERKRLYWLVTTCIIFIIGYVSELLSIAGLLYTDFDKFIFLYHSMAACFIVFWVSIYGLNQKSLQLQKVIELENGKSSVVDESDSTHQRKIIFQRDAVSEEKYKTILKFFEETKIYKNKDVNLFMVSDLIQLPYRDVSKLINNYSNKNFSQFVNEFRIAESKQLLLSDYFEKYSLSSIGEEVGFNSRATFFSAFKGIVGKTPLEYRNSSISAN